MSFLATVYGKPSFGDREAEESAKSFKKAMKGIGTDEKRVIKEIISLNNHQRQIVKEKYKLMYGHSLEEDLKSELNGDFEDIVVALLKPKYQYEAECLRSAIHGIGTKEERVIELLCTKEAHEIEQLKQAYRSLYSKDLEHDIKGEEDGPLGKIFRSLATANRPNNGPDVALAQNEAKALYDAGVGKTFGTDEDEFVRILVSRSFAQLRATFDIYQKTYGKDFESSVISETSGDLEKALVAIVESIRNRPAYFAKLLKKTMEGTGTKEKDLIRLVVTRSEVDLGDVRKEYKNLYNRALQDDLKSELKGDFEDIILELVGK